MKQVLQSYRKGELTVREVPAPMVRPGQLLVQTVASVVSVGTEKAMLELARKSLLGKALARPDWVRQVVDKVRTEGVLEAYRQASARLESPLPLGYSSAGIVVGVGSDITTFEVGDRVACTGNTFACHAEIVAVPENLCTVVPESADLEDAAFVALGAIALHSVRMCRAELGLRLVIIGLGVLGQLAIQIAKAAGCHVLGVDIDPARTQLALEHGADMTADGGPQTADAVRAFSDSIGADAVLILAATDSNGPIELAAEISRERGRIVAAGTVGLNIPRKPFFEKELDFVVPRAWGPGIFDPDYEQRNVKYPLPYVRWTTKRNMDEFLRLVAHSKVRIGRIITHRFPIERAQEAYDLIAGKTGEPFMGVLLTYPTADDQRSTAAQLARRIELRPKAATSRSTPSHQPSTIHQRPVGVGLIGAGLFAKGAFLPALEKVKGLRYVGVATASGLSGRHVGKKYCFAYCTTDYKNLLDDHEIDVICILTRHNLHGPLVVEALKAGKHVFVEKPLGLNEEQLRAVIRAYRSQLRAEIGHQLLMVGFNRRFSPFTAWVKERLGDDGQPMVVNCRVNAGFVSQDSWVHDPDEGGGRVIGEVCHFIDLVQHLTGALPVLVYAHAMSAGGAYLSSDNVVITIRLSDGSVANIAYTAAGDKAFPRERVEVFKGGAVALIDNFKFASFTRGGRTRRKRTFFSVDRGYKGEFEALFTALRNGGPAPVDFTEYVATTLATFAIEESLRQGVPVRIDTNGFIRAALGSKDEEFA